MKNKTMTVGDLLAAIKGLPSDTLTEILSVEMVENGLVVETSAITPPGRAPVEPRKRGA